jgi:ribosomal protein S18 acetylase RimI-like enzyme
MANDDAIVCQEPRGGDRRAQRGLAVLTPADVERAAALLARAFAADPSHVALVPDENERLRLLRLHALVRLRTATRHAAAYGVTEDGTLAGVAVWHPPGVAVGAAAAAAGLVRLFEGGRRSYRTLRHIVSLLRGERAALRRFASERARAAREAQRGQVWYLALLGTDAAFRRRGVARRLLEHVLARCDLEGLAAWTESSEAGNTAMYQRFGFEVVAHLPSSGVLPDLWVLRREPRPASAPPAATAPAGSDPG